jgi:hypothetical protein
VCARRIQCAEITRCHVARLPRIPFRGSKLRFSFRDTKLEDFHDRFCDEEMKTLMIDVVNHSYAFLSILFCTDNSNKLIELLNEKDEIPA